MLFESFCTYRDLIYDETGIIRAFLFWAKCIKNSRINKYEIKLKCSNKNNICFKTDLLWLKKNIISGPQNFSTFF